MKLWSMQPGDLDLPNSKKMFEDRIKAVGGPVGAGVKGNHFLKSRSHDDLQAMDPMDLFMELIKDITDELDVNTLCFKILYNVSILTRSDRGSLFLTRSVKGVPYLFSKLFDVHPEANLESALHTQDTEIRVPFGVGIAGTVAQTKVHINIKDAYSDPRFNQEVDKKTGFRTRNILCMPIISSNGVVLGVAQIMNKTDGSDEFSKKDEQVFGNYLSFCGIGLSNAQLFEMSVHEYKRNELQLSLARNIFEVQTSMDELIRKILLDAQEMLKAERCIVWLVTPDAPSKDRTIDAFSRLHEDYVKAQIVIREDASAYKKHQEAMQSLKGEGPKTKRWLKHDDALFDTVYELFGSTEVTTPSIKDLLHDATFKVASEVAITGKQKVLEKEEAENVFQNKGATEDDHKVFSCLALPIKDEADSVIGVVQVMNKTNGKSFEESDINNLETFSIFCGLGLHNCQMYENVCKLMARQQVALEVLSYHASATEMEADSLLQSSTQSIKQFKLDTYEFDDLVLDDISTCQATMAMFLDSKLIEELHLQPQILARWILSVKKNYRPVTYHNWRHGFNVAQSMFTIIYTGGLSKYLGKLEIIGLLVACLCHDLDHRGTNNTFQAKSDSPLATLYGTSTMEHHHFDQFIMILNSEGNNIFANLPEDSYRMIIKYVESAILSTDLALYFKKKGNFQSLIDKGNTDWETEEKKELLRSMMMTACDVAAITKPWEIQLRVAHLVADEFFEQGDIERQKLNLEPIAMMDRKKIDELPKMQVGFIDAICLPLYKMLADVEVGTKPLLDGCKDNRRNWQDMADKNLKQASQEAVGKGSSSDSKTSVKAFPFFSLTSKQRRKRKDHACHVHAYDSYDSIPDHEVNGRIRSTKVARKSQTCILL